MIDVNLLPWRQELRLQHRKQFLVELGIAAFVGFVFILFFHVIVASKVSRQQARNGFITEQIGQLHEKIKAYKALETEQKQLVHNLDLIQSLHNNRFKIVGILDELVRLVPKSVHLTRIKQKGNHIVIEGTATSNDDITRLMKNIEGSKWLTNPVLSQIRVDNNDFSKRHFELEAIEKGSKILTVKQVKEVG